MNTFLDKTAWPPGPWQDEPDHLEWYDEATSYHCLMHRNEFFGFWCGYVGIDATHPYFGKSEDLDLFAHGGITNSDACHPGRGASSGEDTWWIGFDCGHGFDYSPVWPVLRDAFGLGSLRRFQYLFPGVYEYRDIEFVKREIENLARQLKNFHGSESL